MLPGLETLRRTTAGSLELGEQRRPVNDLPIVCPGLSYPWCKAGNKRKLIITFIPPDVMVEPAGRRVARISFTPIDLNFMGSF